MRVLTAIPFIVLLFASAVAVGQPTTGVERQPSCRVIDPPAGAWIAGVSGYEPDGAEHSFGSKRIPTPVQVRVERPGEVVLVLNIYEPAIWRVTQGPQTRVVAVVSSGYYRSPIEMIGASVYVVVDYEGREQRVPQVTSCEQQQDMSFGYQGSRDGLERQTFALIGRKLDSLVGEYKLKDVVVR